ncbi:hypothetical protein [uncultured Gordonia sp.]|uniref:hypothetical protein n=1 Tax=uncultured Gordonia sp. TaxID=198437 RepID=UPI002589906A|nr:hypothetical protein [uncultured Gordonia sp.]
MNTFMQDIVTDNRCDWSGLIVSQCAHCRGLISVFVNDNCSGCGVGLVAGDPSAENFCNDCDPKDVR